MLGNDLKQLRKQRGLTQKQLGKEAGLSTPTISLLEQGRGLYSSLEKALSVLHAEVWAIHLERDGTLGKRIQNLRIKRKISQRKAARIIEVTQATISKIERNNKGQLHIYIALAKVCGCQLRINDKQEATPFYRDIALSSVNEVWLTPPSIITSLNETFGQFDLDPCAETHNQQALRSKALICYTAADNGLTKPWFGTVFVNPPYSRDVGKWIDKCFNEIESNNASTVIALVAARTDTKWWHEYIANKASVFLIRGRLKFGDGKQSAPFPSAVVIWSYKSYSKEQLADKLNAWHVG